MGMERVVMFDGGQVPSWPQIRDLLAGHSYPVQLRMIEGELAFPNEMPPESWRELRVGTPQGMVTLRRGPDRVSLVTWGNAEPPMRQAWNALTWAVAEVTGGRIISEADSWNADEFRRQGELPPGLA
jgi:hypothetical protein